MRWPNRYMEPTHNSIRHREDLFLWFPRYALNTTYMQWRWLELASWVETYNVYDHKWKMSHWT